MTDSEDYRLYLEEKFRGIEEHLEVFPTLINGQFKDVHTELKFIKEQTTKTNDRVTHLEDKVIIIDKNLLEHPVNCKLVPEFNKLKEDLIEYKFFKKYPKAMGILIAVFVGLMLLSAYGTLRTIGNSKGNKELMDKVNQIELEVGQIKN
jgi:hypothetical protein